MIEVGTRVKFIGRYVKADWLGVPEGALGTTIKCPTFGINVMFDCGKECAVWAEDIEVVENPS